MMDLFLDCLRENAGDETRAPLFSFDGGYINQPIEVDYMVYVVSLASEGETTPIYWLVHGIIGGQYVLEVCVPGFDEEGNLQPVRVSEELKSYLGELVKDRYEEWLSWDGALRLLEEHNLPWWRIEQLLELISSRRLFHPDDHFGDDGLFGLDLFVEEHRELARLSLVVADYWSSSLRAALLC